MDVTDGFSRPPEGLLTGVLDVSEVPLKDLAKQGERAVKRILDLERNGLLAALAFQSAI